MSKQANPTLIGSFALGGAALLVVFVLIIAGDSLFSKHDRYVIVFNGSINGLTTGSNVMFRGVPIGFVSDIEVVADYSDMTFSVPVYVDINSDTIRGTGLSELGGADNVLQALINRGLRASLSTESFITGKLLVELDFHPDAEALYRDSEGDLPEIPSIESGIQAVLTSAEEFLARLQQSVDVEDLMNKVESAITGIDQLANSQDLRDGLSGMNQLFTSNETQQLTGELNATLDSLRKTMNSADTTLTGLNENIGGLAGNLNAVLERAEEVLRLAEKGISDNSDLTYRVNTALHEVENAARSIRSLTEYLEQDPSAIIRGKSEESYQDE
jgi:paraquat-inducible protein B